MDGGTDENAMKAVAFRQQIKIYTGALTDPGQRSARLAAVARDALAALQASGRAGPAYTLFVDNRPASSEDSVRGDGTGKILYQFSYIGDAVIFALDFLKARAPSRSGKYRNSFFVGVDGRFVNASAFSPDSVPPTAEIIIGNSQPYNRKVDVQLSGGKVLQFSVPPGEYDDCAAALKQRFGNTLSAKRLYDVNFPGKYLLHRDQRRKSGRRAGSAVRRAGDAGQSPAIVITPII